MKYPVSVVKENVVELYNGLYKAVGIDSGDNNNFSTKMECLRCAVELTLANIEAAKN